MRIFYYNLIIKITLNKIHEFNFKIPLIRTPSFHSKVTNWAFNNSFDVNFSFNRWQTCFPSSNRSRSSEVLGTLNQLSFSLPANLWMVSCNHFWALIGFNWQSGNKFIPYWRKEKKRSQVSGLHQYLHIVEKWSVYPCLLDGEEVISFPPVTNAANTRLLFIA